MPIQKKKTAIDFGDEEAVLADVAAAMEADIEECVIEEDRGMSSFGEGTVYQVEWGVEEYHVAKNHDQAYALAVEVVKQDLEQEPESSTRTSSRSHIDKDKLRDELQADALKCADRGPHRRSRAGSRRVLEGLGATRGSRRQSRG